MAVTTIVWQVCGWAWHCCVVHTLVIQISVPWWHPRLCRHHWKGCFWGETLCKAGWWGNRFWWNVDHAIWVPTELWKPERGCQCHSIVVTLLASASSQIVLYCITITITMTTITTALFMPPRPWLRSSPPQTHRHIMLDFCYFRFKSIRTTALQQH